MFKMILLFCVCGFVSSNACVHTTTGSSKYTVDEHGSVKD